MAEVLPVTVLPMTRSVPNIPVCPGRPPPQQSTFAGEATAGGEHCNKSLHGGRQGGSKRDGDVRPNVLQTSQGEGLISATHCYAAKTPC